MNSGIPVIAEYNKAINSKLFFEMEKFSEQFLAINADVLVDYKWSKDPLHQWSRQWEYPYTYQEIYKYGVQNNDCPLNILDAGSGITFFPSFIAATIPKTNVTCCDYDTVYTEKIALINSRSMHSVNFDVSDLHKLPYEDNTFDIIYCISVLEHTEQFELIIKEFKRILKDKGLLIVTFDISIDGQCEITPKEAEILLKALQSDFCFRTDVDPGNIIDSITHSDILTTRYIKTINKNLLPWRCKRIDYILAFLRSIKHFKLISCCPNLTVSCHVLYKCNQETR